MTTIVPNNASHCAANLARWKECSQEMTANLLLLTTGLDETTLNQRPAADVWSPAQVVEHLVITNSLYLPVMEAALNRATRILDDPPVRYTPVGKFLCKAAGPDGNAPTPPALHPSTTTISLTILKAWEGQQAQLLSLLENAAGVDLSRTRIWNPLVRVIPMNLADCFELLTAHTRRHLSQIEARIPVSIRAFAQHQS